MLIYGVNNDNRVTWFTGGDAPWTVSDQLPFEGTVALRSGDVTTSQRSLLMAYLDGPINIGFVSQIEGNGSELLLVRSSPEVLSPGTLLKSMSAGRQFDQLSLGTSEPYQVVWEYTRLQRASDTLSAAYVDNITLSESAIASPLPQGRSGGGSLSAWTVWVFAWALFFRWVQLWWNKRGAENLSPS